MVVKIERPSKKEEGGNFRQGMEKKSSSPYSGEGCMQHFVERCWHWSRTLKYWHLVCTNAEEHRLLQSVMESVLSFQDEVCERWIGLGKEIMPFGECTAVDNFKEGSGQTLKLLDMIYEEAGSCLESGVLDPGMKAEFENFISELSKFMYLARLK